MKVQRNDYKTAWDRTEEKAAKDAKEAKEQRYKLQTKIDDLEEQIQTMKNDNIRARVHQDAGDTSYMSAGSSSFVAQSPVKLGGLAVGQQTSIVKLNMQPTSAELGDHDQAETTTPSPTKKQGGGLSLTNSKVIDMSAKKEYQEDMEQ